MPVLFHGPGLYRVTAWVSDSGGRIGQASGTVPVAWRNGPRLVAWLHSMG